jgi:hypothetical protein
MTYLTSARVRRKGHRASNRGEIGYGAGAGAYRRAKRFSEADP